MFDFIDTVNKSYLDPNTKISDFVSFVSASSQDNSVMQYGDQETLNKVYENLEIVYRCVFMAANNLARLPKKIIRKDQSGNEVDVSDLFPLIKNPNDEQTEYDFWVESISRFMMQGELFWELLLDNSKYPIAIFPDWRSEEVTIIAKDNIITGFQRNIRDSIINFTPQEVFYIKNFNPNSKYRGLSALRPSRHSVELDFNAINFNKNFFNQGLKLNGILQTDQELDDNVAKRLRKEFEKIYGGIDNMHKTAVLHSGLSFTALNDMSLTDAQFMELRKMNRENIAVAFGTPLEILGIGKATFQNERYARRKYWTETLFPEITRFESAINKFLIPLLINSDTKFEYQFKFIIKDIEALKEDRSAKVKDYVQGIALRAITPNEMRIDVFGKEPFEGKEFNLPIESTSQPTIPKHICEDAIQQKKKFY